MYFQCRNAYNGIGGIAIEKKQTELLCTDIMSSLTFSDNKLWLRVNDGNGKCILIIFIGKCD